MEESSMNVPETNKYVRSVQFYSKKFRDCSVDSGMFEEFLVDCT
jgi:hypothetical protein